MGKNVIISTLPNISQNYLPKVNTSNIFANSLVYDDGSSVLINTTTASAFRLDVNGTGRFQGALTLTGALSGTSATFSGQVDAASFYTSDTRYVSNQIQAGYNTNAEDVDLWVNYSGYQGGTTRFRDFRIGNGKNGQIAFFDGSTSNVGIGTTSPTDNIIGSGTFLDISSTTGGAVKLHYAPSSTYGELSLYKGSNGSYIDSAGAATLANNDLIFRTGGTASNFGVTERMRITSGGNVGIGSTSPSAWNGNQGLLVSQTGTGNTNTIYSLQSAATSVDTGGILEGFSTNTTSGSKALGSIVFLRENTSTTALSSYTGFYTNNAGTVAERMRITSGGNVLINTTTNNGIRLGQKLNVATLNDYGGIAVTTYAGAAAGRSSVIDLNKSRGTSDGSMTAVANGDEIGYLVYRGSDGTNFLDLGWIRGVVDGAVSTNVMPGTIVFGTNGGSASVSERMRITSGGKAELLIGTQTATWSGSNRGLLELNGASSGTALLGLKINDSQRAYFYHNNTNLYIEQMVNPGSIYVISFSNGVYLTAGATSWTANSDERLKDITGNIENAVDSLLKLRTVKHTWKLDNTKKEHLALIAQDVEKVFPQVIDRNKLPSKANEEQTDNTDYLGVRYTELVPVLVKAIQEQQAQIEEQKADVESLKALINK